MSEENSTKVRDNDIVDVAIIGGGPAGYSAALYASRYCLTHVLFEGTSYGGQLTQTTYVENYPGVGKVGGYELAIGMDLESQDAARDPLTGCIVGQANTVTGAEQQVAEETQKSLQITASSSASSSSSSPAAAVVSVTTTTINRKTQVSVPRPVVVGFRGDALREGARILSYEVVQVECKDVYPFVVYYRKPDFGLYDDDSDGDGDNDSENNDVADKDIDEDSKAEKAARAAAKERGEDPNIRRIRARSIIIATGARAKTLPFPTNEIRDASSRFWNLLTCAVCDGRMPHFRNKPLAVIGGGDAAMEEAVFLAHTSRPVYIIHRSTKFRASPVMLERARSTNGVIFLTDTIVTDVFASSEQSSSKKDDPAHHYNNNQEHETKTDKPAMTVVTACEPNNNNNTLDRLRVCNVVTGDEQVLDVSGLFFAIGHKPTTDLFESQLELQGEGYISITPGTDTESSIKGVHAAGDCQDSKYRQAICAAASGCQALTNVSRWLLLREAEKQQ